MMQWRSKESGCRLACRQAGITDIGYLMGADIRWGLLGLLIIYFSNN